MWIFLMTAAWLIFLLLNVIQYASYYFSSKLAVGGFSQILYTLQNSMSGSEGTWKEVIGDFFLRQWPLLIAGTTVFVFMIWYYRQLKKGSNDIKIGKFTLPVIQMKWVKSAASLLAVSVLFVAGLEGQHFYKVLGIDEYQKSLTDTSDLFDQYYADPGSADIRFPGKKKNLIYILCESMEQTYAGKETGGGMKKSLIPELTKLAKENNDFSMDKEVLNGAYTPGNTTWTIAGISAQTMGIPLNLENATQVWNRNFDKTSQFLPYVTALGDILKSNGYHNYFMCGSDAAFAGRANLFNQHGEYRVFDYHTAIEDKIIDPDHYVWWGYEDLYLFKYAQKELTEIAKQDEPFNFMMLTVDTHFPSGYPCDECPSEFKSQYENVIRCSDHQIARFVKWIQQQDFYKDTTIVIAGDHLSMDADVPDWIDEDYRRKTFFTVINGPEYSIEATREFATIDIYPTIIESLGAQIDGGRLGLGTSLYSNQPTLVERMGYEDLSREMNAKSEFYESVILNGDQSKLPEKPEDSESAEGSDREPQAVTTVTPQEYQQNRDDFADPEYVWSPPVTYPSYPDPAPVLPVQPSPDPVPENPDQNTGETPQPTTPPDTGGTPDETPDGGNNGGGQDPDKNPSGGTGSGSESEVPPASGDNTGTTVPETPPAASDQSGSISSQ